MKTEQEWQQAKEHLDAIRQAYVDIGAVGLFGLRLTIEPALVRYERGERTDELYDEIMEME